MMTILAIGKVSRGNGRLKMRRMLLDGTKRVDEGSSVFGDRVHHKDQLAIIPPSNSSPSEVAVKALQECFMAQWHI